MSTSEALKARPLSASDPAFWEALSTKRGVDKGLVKRYEILVNKIGRGEVLTEQVQSKLGQELVERTQARMLHFAIIAMDPDAEEDARDSARRNYAAYENTLSDIDEIVKTYEQSLVGLAEVKRELEPKEE